MDSKANTQWFDILPPQPPNSGVDYLSIVIILVAIAFAGILLARFHMVKATFLLLKINIYRRLAWLDNRNLAYEMGYLLSLALHVAQLRKNTVFSAHNLGWSEFLQRLDLAKYGSQALSDQETLQLLGLTRYWLIQLGKHKLRSMLRLKQMDKACK